MILAVGADLINSASVPIACAVIAAAGGVTVAVVSNRRPKVADELIRALREQAAANDRLERENEKLRTELALCKQEAKSRRKGDSSHE